MSETKVIVELCQSNSLGSTYREPTVKEWREVTRREADELLASQLPNGLYWREQPADKTGAMS